MSKISARTLSPLTFSYFHPHPTHTLFFLQKFLRSKHWMITLRQWFTDFLKPEYLHMNQQQYPLTTVGLQWLEHWWPVYHGCFERVLRTLGKIPKLAIWDNLGRFSFSNWKMVYCVYSLESPRWGDSKENTQHTFLLKKVEKISLLCLLTWCYE